MSSPTSNNDVTTIKLERRKSVVEAVSNMANVSTEVTRRMVCGGLAGMIAKTVTNPLERLKILSQTGEHGGTAAATVLGDSTNKVTPQKVGVLELYKRIIQREGLLGLWAGNGVNLIRVFPAKAVVFSSNDLYQRLLRQASNTPAEKPLSGPLSFISGGLAGMSASALTYPLDLARGRMAGKLAGATAATAAVMSTTLPTGTAGTATLGQELIKPPQRTYRGILQTITLTIQDEGFLALYKGVTPTLIGAMPYEGIKFGTVGLLEIMFPKDPESPPQHSPLRKMMFGGLGGVMAGLITYPNDTVRRMLQLQGSRGTTSKYAGYWDCVKQVYQTQGLARFYRGCFINIVRMAPNTAVQFGSYEVLKQWTQKYI